MKNRTSRILPAIVGLAAVALTLTAGMLGGCAANDSRDWAQTSPVIPPTADGQPLVSLGVIQRGS